MRKSLTRVEIVQAFADPETAKRFPPLLSEQQAAELLHIAPKTLANRRRAGQLDGTFSSEGKSFLYFRDRLVGRIFESDGEWNP